jgi:hypothetical protein
VIVGDIVVLSQLRCEVARQAQLAWHSFIKNGFLWHTDVVLTRWVQDEKAMHEFEVLVLGVSCSVRQLSGALLVDLLGPLAGLRAAERDKLKARLDREFEQDFSPDKVAARIACKLIALSARIRESLAVTDIAERKRALDAIRGAARALSDELKPLKGFWLPHWSVTHAEVKTT